jgi:hypothetical protein
VPGWLAGKPPVLKGRWKGCLSVHPEVVGGRDGALRRPRRRAERQAADRTAPTVRFRPALPTTSGCTGCLPPLSVVPSGRNRFFGVGPLGRRCACPWLISHALSGPRVKPTTGGGGSAHSPWGPNRWIGVGMRD